MTDEKTVEELRQQALEHFKGKQPEATSEVKPEDKPLEEVKSTEEKPLDEQKAPEKKEEEIKKPEDAEVKPNLTDEEHFALLSEKTGRTIKSWDDLKAPASKEDTEKQKEKREADKLSYGLQQGLFNRNQLESFITASKDPKGLVYAKELAEAKKDDPDWDADKEEDFKDEFEKKFGLDLDPTASKYKRGQKQISMLAEQYLKSDFAPIYSLDSAFDKYENETNSRIAQEQKILKEAPVYKETVSKVLADFSKIEMDFEGEKFEVPVPKEITDTLSQVMLDNNFSTNEITKGYTKEKLTEFARQFAIGQNFEKLAFEAAKVYKAKHEKGVRGIPAGGKLEKAEDPYANLDEAKRKALQFFRGTPAQVAN